MMQEFFVVSAIGAWTAIILTFLLNLALVRHVNKMAKVNSHRGPGQISPDDQVTAPTQTDFLPAGTTAPTFKAHMLNGAEVTSENYKGKISVFTFVTNYSPSREFILSLDEKIQSEVEALDFNYTLVGVNSLEDTRALITTTNTPFPSIVAPRTTNPFSIEYKVWSTPLTYVLDQEGKIKWAGNITAQTIESLRAWAG